MKSKTVEIECAQSEADRLASAVRTYARQAYPSGGSECSQVAREALLDAASLIAAHRGGPLGLRRRQMAQLRAAVTWYFTEIDPSHAADGDALLSLLARR